MVRILFVNDNLRLPAGITMVLKNIIENSKDPDIKYSILTVESERNNAVEYFKKRGVEIFYMPVITETSTNDPWKKLLSRVNVFSLFKIKSFFKQFFCEHTFDIVHSHFAQIDKCMFPIAKSNGVKICISHSHSSRLADTRFRSFRNKVLCYDLINIADYCAACSESAGIALFGKNFPNSSKKIIINNGIDTSRFKFSEESRRQMRKRYNIDDNSILIGSIGRLNIVKNQLFLLEVIKELRKTSRNYILMLVGGGELDRELRYRAKELGIEQFVIFAGSQMNIPDYLSAFDLFVMPSLHEGLGLAAVEAQANGLECVVSSSVPHEVDLTGVSFIRLDEGASKWADCIMSMSCLHHDSYLRCVEQAGYDINTVCIHLCSFYKSILS